MITHVKNQFISYVNMTSSNNNFHNHDRDMGIWILDKYLHIGYLSHMDWLYMQP